MSGNRTGTVEASDAIAKFTIVRGETKLGEPVPGPRPSMRQCNRKERFYYEDRRRP